MSILLSFHRFRHVQIWSHRSYLMIYQALEQVEKDLLAVVEACAEVGRVSHFIWVCFCQTYTTVVIVILFKILFEFIVLVGDLCSKSDLYCECRNSDVTFAQGEGKIMKTVMEEIRNASKAVIRASFQIYQKIADFPKTFKRRFVKKSLNWSCQEI